MTAFTRNTDDWELHACLDWKRKWKTVKCDRCNGTGITPLGMRDNYYGDATNCSSCQGRGSVERQSTSERPPIPAELVEHLRRAWWDYHNPKQKEPNENSQCLTFPAIRSCYMQP